MSQQEAETRLTPGELLGREFITSVVVFHEVVGRAMGLSPVERKCMDVLKRLGPVTAGEIADHTGLTSGAVTGLIDRLVKAGFAERTRDEHDRRRVVVQLTTNDEMDRRTASIFGPLGADMHELMSTYSAEELAVIADFQRRTTDVLVANTRRLQEHPTDREA